MELRTTAEHDGDGEIRVADGRLLAGKYGSLQPSNPNLPIETLRERFKKDGYLYLKGLLPREHALKAREAYFQFLSPSGILKRGSAPVDGIYDSSNNLSCFGGLSSDAVDLTEAQSHQAAKFSELIAKAHTKDWYTEGFCKHPELQAFVARLTDWADVRLFERSLLRCSVPLAEPTQVHYDQIFLRQGDVTNITAWCVMGDIKVNGGGLMYLDKSATLGEDIENEFTSRAIETGLSAEEAKNAYNRNMMAAGGLSRNPIQFAAQNKSKWLVSAFEAGDVVLHTPFTVHASTINIDSDSAIRLSTDLRFYDATRPYDKRWLNHFSPGDGL